ncbi:hypothetical protein CWI37_2211p0010, partial [Hamiltosporidium tvaerminnensis]
SYRFKKEYYISHFKGGTSFEEPTININGKSDIEGGIVNVKDVKEVYKSHNDVLI